MKGTICDCLEEKNLNAIQKENNNSTEKFYSGTRYQPTWKYVWNEYLQESIRLQVHPRWLLFIVHGNLKYMFIE